MAPPSPTQVWISQITVGSFKKKRYTSEKNSLRVSTMLSSTHSSSSKSTLTSDTLLITPQEEESLVSLRYLLQATSNEQLRELIEAWDLHELQAWHIWLSESPQAKVLMKDLDLERKHFLLSILTDCKIAKLRLVYAHPTSVVSKPLAISLKKQDSMDDAIYSCLQKGLTWLESSMMIRLSKLEKKPLQECLGCFNNIQLDVLFKKCEIDNTTPNHLVKAIQQERISRLAKLPIQNSSLPTLTAEVISGSHLTEIYFKILGKIQQVQEGQKQIGVVKTEDPRLQTIRHEHFNLLSRIFQLVKNTLNFLFSTSATPLLPTPSTYRGLPLEILRLPGPPVDISELVKRGQQRLQQQLDPNNSTHSLDQKHKTQFGLTIATSVVQHQPNCLAIHDSMANHEDELAALAKQLKDDPSGKFLNNTNFFRIGGVPAISTYLERISLENILAQHQTPGVQISKKPSKQFSAQELSRLELYFENLKRSENLNFAIYEMQANYFDAVRPIFKRLNKYLNQIDEAKTKVPRDMQASLASLRAVISQAVSYGENTTKNAYETRLVLDGLEKLSENDFSTYLPIITNIRSDLIALEDVASKNEKYPQLVAQAILQQCKGLSDGESLYLDSLVEDHAMRLSIKKEAGDFVITSYDSSGSLESSSLSRSLMGLVKLQLLEKGRGTGDSKETASRSNALQLRVPEAKLLFEGTRYFHDLFLLGSGRNLIDQKSKQQQLTVSYSSNIFGKFLSFTGLLTSYQYLSSRRWVYLNYIEKLTCLETRDSPAFFLPIKQAPQITRDCYAARTQTNQFYELGIPLFKKIRMATLKHQREMLLQDLNPETNGQTPLVTVAGYDALKAPPAIRSKEELTELSKRLVQLSKTPSKEYFSEYLISLTTTKTHLEASLKDQNLDSIERKSKELALESLQRQLDSFYHDFFLYLQTKPQLISLQHTYFPIDPSTGLLTFYPTHQSTQALISFLCDRAWNDLLCVLGHNIARLDTERRYLENIDQRLPTASLTVAKTAGADDLTQANIVSYIEGFQRKKCYGIELNIQGKRYEISIHNFFLVLAKNPEVLSNLNVIEIIQFLRNHLPSFQHDYDVLLAKLQLDVMKQQVGGHFSAALKQIDDNEEQLQKRIVFLHTLLEELTHEELETANALAAACEPSLPQTRMLQERLKSLQDCKKNFSDHISYLESKKVLCQHYAQELTRTKTDVLASLHGQKSPTTELCNAFIAAENYFYHVVETLEHDNTDTLINEDQLYLSELAHSHHLQSQMLTEGMKTTPSTRALYKLCDTNSRPQKIKDALAKEGSTDAAIQIINKKLFSRARSNFLTLFEQDASEQLAQKHPSIHQNTHLFELTLLWKSCSPDSILEKVKLGLSDEDKCMWNKDMIDLWIKREDPAHLLPLVQSMSKAGLQKQYVAWIEAHTGLSAVDFEQSGLSLEISDEVMNVIFSLPIEPSLQIQTIAATHIQKAFLHYKKKFPLKDLPTKPIQTSEIFVLRNSLPHETYGATTSTYTLSLSPAQAPTSCKALSTIELLSTTPKPAPLATGASQEQMNLYCQQVLSYFEVLQLMPPQEFVQERLELLYREFSQSCLQNYSLQASSISKKFLDHYLNTDPTTLNKLLSTIDNQRFGNLCLTLLLIALSGETASEDGIYSLPYPIYSMALQWINLCPQIQDLQLLKNRLRSLPKSESISILENPWMSLEKFGQAVRKSSFGLEGLHEGCHVIHDSLFQYQSLAKTTEDLRTLSKHWTLQSLHHLSVHLLLSYYTTETLEKELSDPAGRYFFERSLHHCLQTANPSEKESLFSFLKDTLQQTSLHTPTHTSMQIPTPIFLIELTERLGVEAYVLTSSDRECFEKFMEEKLLSQHGEQKIFGCAWKARYIALQLKKQTMDISSQHAMMAEICTLRLSLEELQAQAPPECIQSMQLNHEFKTQLYGLHSDMMDLQPRLRDWIDTYPTEATTALELSLQEKIKNAFVTSTLPSLKPTPLTMVDGVVQLSDTISWDLYHGGIYCNGMRMRQLPSTFRAHPYFLQLGLQNLSFTQDMNKFVHFEHGEAQVIVSHDDTDNTLHIHRKITLKNGSEIWLEYAGAASNLQLPASFIYQAGACQFWRSAQGALYGFDEDFSERICITSNDDSSVRATFVDNPLSYRPVTNHDIYHEPFRTALKDLLKLHALEEIVLCDDPKEFFVPTQHLHLRLVVDGPTTRWICSGFANASYELKPSSKPGLLLQKVLSAEEMTSLQKMMQEQLQLSKQVTDLSTQKSLASQDTCNKLKLELHALDNQITALQKSTLLISNEPLERMQMLDLARSTCVEAQALVQVAYLNFLEATSNQALAWSTYHEALLSHRQAEENLRKLSSDTQTSCVFTIDEDDHWKPQDLADSLGFYLARPGHAAMLRDQLLACKGPNLEKRALHRLNNLIDLLKEPGKEHPRLLFLAQARLIYYLQNQRSLALCSGGDFNSNLLQELVKDISENLKSLNLKPRSLLSFKPLWDLIRSEIPGANLFEQAFIPPQTSKVLIRNGGFSLDLDEASHTPAYTLQVESFISYNIHNKGLNKLSSSQQQLMDRLDALRDLSDKAHMCIESQKSGFFLENFGLFDAKDISQALHLSSSQASSLLTWMLKENYIRFNNETEKFHLVEDPRLWFSKHRLETYFVSQKIPPIKIDSYLPRCESFFYQVAASSGSFQLVEGIDVELNSKIENKIKNHQQESLQAQDILQTSLNIPLNDALWQLLRNAYLMDDYRDLIPYLHDQTKSELAHEFLRLKNSMTRWLYHTTEIQHLTDISRQPLKAGELLELKRQYRLADLTKPLEKPEDNPALFEEQKRLRAFLLFEWQFGHRCLRRQVEIFTGLLIEDNLDPEKIDAAQARMGFGKTSLLPLLALFKADGKRLVRFIVPRASLETNASDLSQALQKTLGKKVIVDHFQRYQIPAPTDTYTTGAKSRLEVLQSINQDLAVRLDLYERARCERCVLIQAPYLRGALEDQLKIFLDLLPTITDASERSSLLQAIHSLNTIRSLRTLSIFDELDATQDPSTTDVNYTLGEKIAIDAGHILPLEKIVDHISQSSHEDPFLLAQELLNVFSISDDAAHSLASYIVSPLATMPLSCTSTAMQTIVLLCRGALCNGGMLKLIREKEPGSDYGVWFEKQTNGEPTYDVFQNKAKASAASTDEPDPLLIAVPYSAAGEPKPRGSRFDNPHVTAIATMRYYRDPKTTFSCIPHLSFLVKNLRGVFTHKLGQSIDPVLIASLQKLQQIEDPFYFDKALGEFFQKNMTNPKVMDSLRILLARLVIVEQVQIDAAHARSDRYEIGSLDHEQIGFSGTTCDTSFLFSHQRLDPAADGKVLYGVMGHERNQVTFEVSIQDPHAPAHEYHQQFIQAVLGGLTPNTRVLIDAGGQCKTSNRHMAQLLIRNLLNRGVQGVVFFDDVSNLKTILRLDVDGNFTYELATRDRLVAGAKDRSLFTLYDQAHARGADVPQHLTCHAIVILGFGNSLNDCKQALLRLRDIGSSHHHQSFSIGLPTALQHKIAKDLGKTSDLKGNDVALWLQQQELQLSGEHESHLFKQEVSAILRSSLLHAQTSVLKAVYEKYSMPNPSIELICANYLEKLSEINTWIEKTATTLAELYGSSSNTMSRESFLDQQRLWLETKLAAITKLTEETALQLGITSKEDSLIFNSLPYLNLFKQAVQYHQDDLPDIIIEKSGGDLLSESIVQVQMQTTSHMQSTSQTMVDTHNFSQVQTDAPQEPLSIAVAQTEYPPANLDFLIAGPFTHVNKLPTFSEVFKTSNTYCSPSYLHSHPIGTTQPLRFILTRLETIESEDPKSSHLHVDKIFIVSPEEADLFLDNPLAYRGYVLLDLYDYPILGSWPLVQSAHPETAIITPEQMYTLGSEHKDLRCLLYSAHRLQISLPETFSSAEKMAHALHGICNVEDCLPHLSVVESKSLESSPWLHMDHWGYSGLHSSSVSISLKPSSKKQGCDIFLETQQMHIPKRLRDMALEKLAMQEKPDGMWLHLQQELHAKHLAATDELRAVDNLLDQHSTLLQGVHLAIQEKSVKSKKTRQEAIESCRTTFKELFRASLSFSGFEAKISQLQARLSLPAKQSLLSQSVNKRMVQFFHLTPMDTMPEILSALLARHHGNQEKLKEDLISFRATMNKLYPTPSDIEGAPTSLDGVMQAIASQEFKNPTEYVRRQMVNFFHLPSNTRLDKIVSSLYQLQHRDITATKHELVNFRKLMQEKGLYPSSTISDVGIALDDILNDIINTVSASYDPLHGSSTAIAAYYPEFSTLNTLFDELPTLENHFSASYFYQKTIFAKSDLRHGLSKGMLKTSEGPRYNFEKWDTDVSAYFENATKTFSDEDITNIRHLLHGTYSDWSKSFNIAVNDAIERLDAQQQLASLQEIQALDEDILARFSDYADELDSKDIAMLPIKFRRHYLHQRDLFRTYDRVMLEGFVSAQERGSHAPGLFDNPDLLLLKDWHVRRPGGGSELISEPVRDAFVSLDTTITALELSKTHTLENLQEASREHKLAIEKLKLEQTQLHKYLAHTAQDEASLNRLLQQEREAYALLQQRGIHLNAKDPGSLLEQYIDLTIAFNNEEELISRLDFEAPRLYDIYHDAQEHALHLFELEPLESECQASYQSIVKQVGILSTAIERRPSMTATDASIFV